MVTAQFTVGFYFSDEWVVKSQDDCTAESGWPLEKTSYWKGIEEIGGDDGTRTRDLMRDRHVKTIAGVDSKGP